MEDGELSMEPTEDLLHKLDGLHGSLQIVERRAGLEGVKTLKSIVGNLEAYVDQMISDLEFEGMTDVAKEARGEGEQA